MSDINLGIVGTSIIAEEHIKVIQSIKKLRLYGITSRSNKRSYNLKRKYNLLLLYQLQINQTRSWIALER